MIHRERGITYRTLVRRVGLDVVRRFAVGRGYVVTKRSGHGVTLKHDWAIGFYRSYWDDEVVYFVRWSAMEFIFRRASRIRSVEAPVVDTKR